MGKSLDGFTPMGPCIVTKEDIGDVQSLDIKCFVNGELRQNSNTKYSQIHWQYENNRMPLFDWNEMGTKILNRVLS